jgi:processive 1,2-diacylglycerol beta-glucosyltransferase
MLAIADRAVLGRVLLLTGSIGSGHTRAAHAVAEAMLRSANADSAEVVDALDHAWPLFRSCYRDAYIAMIERAPGAIGWIYRSSDTIEGGGLRRLVQRAAVARLRRLIQNERPDTIVCTHFLAAEVLSGMIARGEWSGTFGVVVTDLDAHAMWAVCPNADRWFVAIPETVEILVGKGVPRERVVVTGIPIAGAFSARLPSRSDLRTSHGLPPNDPMLLVSGGGVGVSRLGKTLAQILSMPIDCGVALVCGKNDALLREADETIRKAGSTRVRCVTLGFTDHMHELMHAADLAIGKPGGLTSSEALACGLPMAIVHPMPGQEERNSDHLLEWGAAIRLGSPESLAWRLAGLLRDAPRLARMRDAARSHARPFAADAIVDELVRIRRLKDNAFAVLPATPCTDRGTDRGTDRAAAPRTRRHRGRLQSH